MSQLSFIFIFLFLGSAMASDIQFGQLIQNNSTSQNQLASDIQGHKKVSDLGITVASNEQDFKLVLRKSKKKNPLIHRGIASENKRVKSKSKKNKSKKLASVAAVH